MSPAHPIARTLPARSGFTLVELLSTIAIMAILIAVMVPWIGNYVATARATADKQTLTILNDALTRYKTEGGSITALTSGTSIGNVLRRLTQPVTWNGLTHQFMRSGLTYPARSLNASGDGRQYKFTRYGAFTDLNSEVSNKLAALGAGSSAELSAWLTSAMEKTGSSNYLILTNPSSTNLFQISVKVATAGKNVEVWWGDGTTQSYTPSTSSFTPASKTYSTNEARNIIIVGDISALSSDHSDGRSNWGGDIFTMKSLSTVYIHNYDNKATCNLAQFPPAMTSFWLYSSGPLVTGTLKNLPPTLTSFARWGTQSISGALSDLPPSLKFLAADGPITGSISSLPSGLTYFYNAGANTITGDISTLPATLTSFYCYGANTISGNISSLKPALRDFCCLGANTISGNIANLPATASNFTCKGLNTLTGDLSTLKEGHGIFNANDSPHITITANSTTLPSTLSRISLERLSTQSQVDNILAGFASHIGATKTSTERYIYLRGICPTPSASGATNATTLTTAGYSVYTN